MSIKSTELRENIFNLYVVPHEKISSVDNRYGTLEMLLVYPALTSTIITTRSKTAEEQQHWSLAKQKITNVEAGCCDKFLT